MRLHTQVAFITACSLVAARLPAQAAFGVLIGANVSTVSEAKQALGGEAGALFNSSRRKGFDGGVFLKIPLGGTVSIQPEIHYAQKGVTVTGPSITSGVANTELAFKVDYAEVPVLLRLDFGSKSSAIRPLLVAGASAAVRLSCKTDITVGASSASPDCDVDIDGKSKTDPFSKKDVSLVGGGGVALSIPGVTVSLQLRYTQGMKNLNTNESNLNGAKLKNGTFSMLLGVNF